jgi:molybdate transport system permease protein
VSAGQVATARIPLRLLVPSLVGLALLVVPLLGLLGRTPWRALPRLLADPVVGEALRLSLLTATASALVCVTLGVPLAWLLARTVFPGRSLLRAVVTVPLVLPPVVGGVALQLALGRSGWIGRWLYEWWGLTVPFTSVAVVVAQTFVALPFVVITVEAALRSADPRFDEVAATLGASRWFTFRRVTLPLLAPGILAGAVLGWARALGEFGATLTFAGSFPGTTRTMPLAIYAELQGGDPQAAVALSVVLLLLCVAILAGMRERWLGGPHG